MNPEISGFRSLTDHDLQPEIYSFEIATAFDTYLRTEGIYEYPVHIKLDTGMHRLGFLPEETDRLGRFLSGSGTFRVQTVFSHLVASEDPKEDDYTERQSLSFISACRELEAALGYGFLRHLANTAAIRRHPTLQMDMVRLGIGLYGIDPGSPVAEDLQEALCLRTTVAQIKQVPAGETVGYNRRGKVNRDSRIATIRIGYADGYPRSLSNGIGKVLIGGRRFPVIGNICMDMTMIDITGGDDIQVGDQVIVFGLGLPVTEMAGWAGTIPYEILTGISRRVQRIYFEE
jgi:alanine racemase